MTEEIIIDGTDVSGCGYYSPIHDILLNDGQIKTIKKYCYAEDGGCNNTNCYYKQLQRLKQENKLLKNKCKLLQKTLDNECTLCKNNLLCERLEKQDNYRSALEEIREIAKSVSCFTACDEKKLEKIQTKINEVLK